MNYFINFDKYLINYLSKFLIGIDCIKFAKTNKKFIFLINYHKKKFMSIKKLIKYDICDLFYPEEITNLNIDFLTKKYIIESGFFFDVKTFKSKLDNNTPLIIAAEYNDFEILKLLIKHGANVNSKEIEGNSPLWIASHGGHYEIVDYLLKQEDIDINTRDILGKTSLWIAVACKRLKVVQLLLDKGIDKNIPCSDGITPIQLAISKNYQRIADNFFLTI